MILLGLFKLEAFHIYLWLQVIVRPAVLLKTAVEVVFINFVVIFITIIVKSLKLWSESFLNRSLVRCRCLGTLRLVSCAARWRWRDKLILSPERPCRRPRLDLRLSYTRAWHSQCGPLRSFEFLNPFTCFLINFNLFCILVIPSKHHFSALTLSFRQRLLFVSLLELFDSVTVPQRI